MGEVKQDGQVAGYWWTVTEESGGMFYAWIEGEFVGAYLTELEATREASAAARDRAQDARRSA